MEGENPNLRNKEPKVLLYIDNSNFFENAKRFSQRKNEYKVIDGTIRLSYVELINRALDGRFPVKVELYCSGDYYGPSETDKIWETFSRNQINVNWFARSKTTGKEKEVDQSLTADAVEDIINLRNFMGENRVVVLFSGDRDFLPTAKKAIKHGYKVEIWGFKNTNSVGNVVQDYASSMEDKVEIKYVDDIFKYVTFPEWKYDRDNIPAQSIVATVKIPKGEQRENFLKRFVFRAREAFKLPLMGKYYDNENIVLALCAKEVYTHPKCYSCGHMQVENRSYNLQKDVNYVADCQEMKQSSKDCIEIQLGRHFKHSREPLQSVSINFEDETRFQMLPLKNDKKETVLKIPEDIPEDAASNSATVLSSPEVDRILNLTGEQSYQLVIGRSQKPRRKQCYYSFWCPYLVCDFRHTKNEEEYFHKLNKKFENKTSEILRGRRNYKKTICEYYANGQCHNADRSFMCGFFHNIEESACTIHIEKGNCKHSRGSIQCQEESSSK